ncbi:MAG: M17 family peptidase N-terminal domain-containing protein [Acidimicrobiia bacterium]
MPVSFVHDTVPSIATIADADVRAGSTPGDATAVGVLVGPDGPLPDGLDLDWDDLAAAGFGATAGSALTVPRAGAPTLVLLGLGDGLDRAGLRDAAATLARTAAKHRRLAIDPTPAGLTPDDAAQVVTEGVLLARYRYDVLKAQPTVEPVETLIVVGDDVDAIETGLGVGRAMAEAQAIARDLANDPPIVLTAARFGDIAENLGPERGLTVEVFDKAALEALGCGGLLGVNLGSAEPPRMIKLTYVPDDPNGHHLSLVGKGIMYDAGGLALKPADETHANMKNDMSGAGSIFGAMLQLRALGCRTTVVGYLMCTDNRPSGTAIAMGDVLSIRGGTTVEVANTDAEGRLVMADALVLATETDTQAIVDIATLTGATMRALGTSVAGLFGNDQALVDQVAAASAATDESAWQMPLERRYRNQLDSSVADIKNLGGPNAGGITAALFLDHFVDGRPWAHLDIAGVAESEADTSWHTPGCTGFGARLLARLACDFTPTGA